MTNNVSLALVATDRDEIKELEHRILTLLPGADKIPPQVRLMVAQAALVYGLDPFMGELMAIPQKDKQKRIVGWSLYTGVKGMRKAARNSRQARYVGRYLAPLNDENAKEFFDMTAEEVCQANGLTNEDKVWVCAVFLEGSSQPFVELGVVGPSFPYVGKAPLFKMAKKRAEHAALCAAFDLPFVLRDEVNGGDPEEIGVISVQSEVLPSTEEEKPALTEEVIDGEYEPVEGQDEARYPDEPEAVKERLLSRAAEYKSSKPASDKQKGLAAFLLERVWEEGEADVKAQNRRLVLKWLFDGRDSLNDLTGAEMRSLLDWLVKKGQDEGAGKYAPDEVAAEEARRILRQALVDAGQQELPLEPIDDGNQDDEQAEPAPEAPPEPAGERELPKEAEELCAHLQGLVSASRFASDPAPEGMVRAVRSSLDKKHGEGAADRIAQAVFGVISLEEVTKAQAMAMQNVLGTNNGKWAGAVEAILAGEAEKPEPIMDEREYADVIGADYDGEEPEEEEASLPADVPQADPVIQAAVKRYGAEVSGVEPPEPRQEELPFEDEAEEAEIEKAVGRLDS